MRNGPALVIAVTLFVGSAAGAQSDPSTSPPPLPNEEEAPSAERPPERAESAVADPSPPELPATAPERDAATAPAGSADGQWTSHAPDRDAEPWPAPGEQRRSARLAEPSAPQHYGSRFLFLDPIVLGAFTWGVFSDNPGLVAGSVAGYLLAGPLVHFFSGEIGNAGWSLLARTLAVPTVFAIFFSLSLSSRVGCKTAIACRNLLFGLVAAGLLVGWMHDVFNAEPAPSTAMRLWSVAPAVGASDRGDPTWGLLVRF